MRVLLSRRWVVFALVVALAVWVAYLLGQWQFDRQTQRESRNEITRINLAADPVPVGEVLAPGQPVDPEDEWRVVEARGTYAADDTIVIRYRTRNGAAGVDLVTPLVTTEGPALLVDRGWLETDSRPIEDRSILPQPPAGEVTVRAWVRVDATGRSAEVEDASARAISSEEIAPTLDYPVYGGFADLVEESPAAADPLELAPGPDLGEGPHFFYGLQWWFFAAMAIFGFGYLAFDEIRARRRGEDPRRGQRSQKRGQNTGAQRARSIPPSTGSIAPDTNDAAGESTKAATRPNSSG
ncbi:cytochrome oxidase assembly protein ShyY1 [Nocardioides massiliensis]|uniref:SURF1-like protein n=2 Tax=Nocardioides massiliensis TaxID=1325935 RepID=A0ABT9NS40_9ACTN|nr:SURF1 family protein [Nocardioides massiliensis]MDP9823097.1 cytochrome oxidase assembly protein ShyY1 [Nocardioides massiliensis]